METTTLYRGFSVKFRVVFRFGLWGLGITGPTPLRTSKLRGRANSSRGVRFRGDSVGWLLVFGCGGSQAF